MEHNNYDKGEFTCIYNEIFLKMQLNSWEKFHVCLENLITKVWSWILYEDAMYGG